MLPLYSDLRDRTIDAIDPTAHPGLLFDKFIDRWEEPPNCKPKEDNAKRRFYCEIAKRLECIQMQKLITDRLAAVLIRRRRLVLARGGRCYTAKTTARLIIGLGAGHPFEAGLTWHPTLGVPYLPGSSIKGMIRALAEPKPDSQGRVLGWGDKAAWDNEHDKTQALKRLFGDTDDFGAGSIIVFDALLSVPDGAARTCAKLDIDIMTPHYGPYYQHASQNPPADWYSPTPIPFLAVAADQTFEFALAPSRIGRARGTADLHKAKALLDEALQVLGIGGKTAVGYGRMGDLKDVTEECEGKLQKEAEKERRERVASEHEARVATLSGVDKELGEFALAWQEAETPRAAQDIAEPKAAELVKRLESASSDDQKKIAQAVKPFYIRIGKWQGKALNEKQKKKVGRIKEILGE